MKDITTGNNQKVMQKIREYAVQQLRSWETLETVVMILLVLYMIFLFTVRKYQISIYSAVLFVCFLALVIFGVYETVPALIMYFRPFDSRAFGMKANQAEKQRICEEIDASTAPLHRHEMTDMTCTENYCLLEGVRQFERLRRKGIAGFTKEGYQFRPTYKRA